MKITRKFGLVIAVLALFLITPMVGVQAETKEIIAEGTYVMGDGETPGVAQERALVEAKRLAVEQAGTYLESFTEVRNLQLSKDEIRVITSGVTETTVIDKKREVVGGDAIRFWVKVRCVVNTDNIQTMKARLQDRQAVETLKKVQEDYDRVAKENAELKQQLQAAKTDQERKQAETRITQNEQAFTAVQWFEKGYDYQVNKKDYDTAIVAYSQAIALNPGFAEAYDNRGSAYYDKSQYDRAIADYDQAIALDPRYAGAYNNRGTAYSGKGQYDRAIADYDQAIALDQQYANAYYNRGNSNYYKGQYDRAITDYDQAIALNPQDATVYYNRGNTYNAKGQYDRAIADYTQAIALNPQDAATYHNRGLAYHNKGLYYLAITDYDRAITLDPQLSQAYYNRGFAYADKGQYDLAIADYDQAIALNLRYFQAYFNKGIACEKVGRTREAISAYRQFIAFAPPQDAQRIEQVRWRIVALGG